MKDFIFGDMFIFFKEQFNIEERDIFATYYEFDKQQALKAGAKIFFKELNKDDKRKNLLLCIRSSSQSEQFAFSYWIPESIVQKGDSLLNILEIFCKEFGCKIRVSKKNTGYFFSLAEFATHMKEIQDPNEVVENLESVDIPCKTFFFYEKQEINGAQINENENSALSYFYIYYCFSINEFRYNGWLYDIPMVTMKVPMEWHSSLENVTKLLNPLGSTKVKILKTRKNYSSSQVMQDQTDKDTFEISFPKKYKGFFEHSVKLIKGLQENEKIALIPVQENLRCLFCGSGDDMSREHIFPKWLRKYIEDINFESSGFLNIPDKSNSISEYIHTTLYDNKLDDSDKSTAYGFTVREVCRVCNNGWMAKLEEDVKNILVNDEELVIVDEMTLDFQQSYLLSLWLFKIWLLTIHRTPSQRIPMFMFRDLMLGKLPEGLIIETSQAMNNSIGSTVALGSSPFIALRPKNIVLEDARKYADDFISCTLHIGRNLFRISYLPPGNPLTRKPAIKQTKVLFPYNGTLELVANDKELEEKILGGDNSAIELFMFSITIILA
jgi:hypothetical protein